MRLLAVALTILALAASGCSGDDDPETTTTSESTPSESSAPPVAETEDPGTEEPAEPMAATPCTLIADADVNAAFGTLVTPGEPGTGQHDEDGVSYTSTTCEWEEEGTLELELAVSTAADFGGTLACTPVSYLGDEGTAVKVPGAQSATWLASEDPNEIEARLRVCTTEATLNLELDAATGTSVDQLRKQTISLAEMVISALG